MAPRVPGIRARLADVALAMYEENGYSGTTVAAIAGRAGVTERTYFRHFPDKREVLFANDSALRDVIAEAIKDATPSASASEAVRAGLDAAAQRLQPRRAELLRREAVVSTNAELRERELAKLASWTLAIDESLVRRGTPTDTATLLAEVSMRVFAVAAQRWMAAGADAALSDRVTDVFDELTALVQP